MSILVLKICVAGNFYRFIIPVGFNNVQDRQSGRFNNFIDWRLDMDIFHKNKFFKLGSQFYINCYKCESLSV